ncbi:MAG: hypothetical protein ACT4O9_14520 [Blastocatellia bacterium]
MNDWAGIAFFVLLITGAFFGIRALANQKKRTSEEFERNAAEGTTAIGVSMNALQELMNPEAAKTKEVTTQMKEGRYQKKKREGKTADDAETEGRRDMETGSIN